MTEKFLISRFDCNFLININKVYVISSVSFENELRSFIKENWESNLISIRKPYIFIDSKVKC